MSRIIGDMDMKIEEALIENEARNDFNRRQAKTIDDYLKETRWIRFKSYVRVEVKIALIEISDGLKGLSTKL
jgi:hypothetical protein